MLIAILCRQNILASFVYLRNVENCLQNIYPAPPPPPPPPPPAPPPPPEAPPAPELEKALVKEEEKLLLKPKGENELAELAETPITA